MIAAYTLVIVHMQAYFTPSQDPEVVAAVSDEIRQAMALRQPIVFMWTGKPEFYGHVDERLLALVANYDPSLWTIETNVYDPRREHSASSGALQVADAAEVFNFPTNCFRVCGVNTDVCVILTMWELLSFFPDAQIVLLERASNGWCESSDSREVGRRKLLDVFRSYAAELGFSNYLIELE